MSQDGQVAFPVVEQSDGGDARRVIAATRRRRPVYDARLAAAAGDVVDGAGVGRR